jgi:hypothetical protein
MLKLPAALIASFPVMDTEPALLESTSMSPDGVDAVVVNF